jgi:Mce-associated membrane protein
VPPRTRATASTAPAGRRPKVAGLRAPGRSGVTAGSTRSDGPHDDEVDEPDTELADTAAPAAADDAPASEATDAAASRPAGADAPEGPGDSDDDAARTGTGRTGAGKPDAAASDRPAPTSKARRTGGAMSPTPSGSSSGRGGAAVLDRPAPARPASPTPEPEPRRARMASAVTKPFRALGANPKRLTVVLAVVLVVCLVLATVAFLAARSDREDGKPYANQAVVDVGGTAEVVGQTRQAMEQILSYDFTKLDDSVNAAKTQSTGAFTSQYLQVFEQTIRGPAQQQKLRQTASVLNIGVRQLSGDHATLMALVQFTAERTTNQQTTNAPGLLTVQVVRQDGRWKISELKPM